MSTPVGPYTPIVRAGDWLVVSGQVGLGADGLAEGFEGQLRQALANLAGLVEGAGARIDQITKTTVFLVDMGDYAALNDVYIAFFDERAGGHRPARSAVAVAALPIDARVEVEAWVFAPGG
ncbi:MAG TPA: RidA family protein [Microthrixaceae bacterium]|nr:RidA family protein [Microthrixaceae bacterium]